jgi:hypothetical protein
MHMGLKANGLTEPSNRNSVLGITVTDTVMLDFDETPFKTVKDWASRTCRWFRLRGFVILRSSKNCYHVVFDRKVTWNENVSIVAYVCLGSKHQKLTGWFILQCRQKASTLRVTRKKDKPPPRIVFRSGSQNDRIAQFLKFRKLVKTIARKLDSDN